MVQWVICIFCNYWDFCNFLYFFGIYFSITIFSSKTFYRLYQFRSASLNICNSVLCHLTTDVKINVQHHLLYIKAI